jgi:SAM-dependent methyltransferase
LSSIESIGTYDKEAHVLAGRYERIAPEEAFGDVLDLLPTEPGAVLDVGAGSGRDAAWFAGRGHQVVAIEPAAGMRTEAARRHSDLRIKWMDDRLPGLDGVHRLGMAFDFILLGAVWQHVVPGDRRRAFRKLVTLLKPGGRLFFTLRHGPEEPGRPMYPVSVGELEKLAAEHGAVVVRAVRGADQLGRDAVQWEHVVLQLADDGTGALPLIRHIILNDAKASTYKLALLRTVARAADASPGLAITDTDDFVTLPLGLVALYWVRAFLPLIAADLPQTPNIRGGSGLGFVKEPFRHLAGMSSFELRVGAAFFGDTARAVAGAIRDAAKTIVTMPAHYITFPGSDRSVFETKIRRPPRFGESIVLDAAFLWSFGDFRVPTNVWMALTRLNAWIEPTLIGEWVRLMERYLERQGRVLPAGTAHAALRWLDPIRDTNEVRQITRRMLADGQAIFCVWSGRRLGDEALDIDHCLPFAAWPNGDLWNLMPASARLNRHQKGDRLVSASLLDRVHERILDWWDRAYVRRSDGTNLRFGREAAASLPISAAGDGAIGSEDVFEGLAAKRLMLKVTQQLSEWDGP